MDNENVSLERNEVVVTKETTNRSMEGNENERDDVGGKQVEEDDEEMFEDIFEEEMRYTYFSEYTKYFHDRCDIKQIAPRNRHKYRKRDSRKQYNGKTRTVYLLSDDDVKRLAISKSEKLVSIGFVGINNNNTQIVNDILGQEVFEPYTKKPKTPLRDYKGSGGHPDDSFDSKYQPNSIYPIQSYHDNEKKRVFLYFSYFSDFEYTEDYDSKKKTKEMGVNVKEIEFKFLKNLLFMFNLCRMIFFVLPKERKFPLKYLTLFRRLQILKADSMDLFNSTLLNSGFTIDSYSKFEAIKLLPCLNFIFIENKKQTKELLKLKSLNYGTNLNGSTMGGSRAKYSDELFSKIEYSLEKEVRMVLKRGKFIESMNRRNPIFHLDTDQCVFLVFEKDNIDRAKEYHNFFAEKFFFDESTVFEEESEEDDLISKNKSSPGDKNKDSLNLSSSSSKSTGNNSKSKVDSIHSKKKGGYEHKFLKKSYGVINFINRKVEYMLARNINTGRGPVRNAGRKFLLPNSYDWYMASFAFESLLYRNFIEYDKTINKDALLKIRKYLDFTEDL